MPSKKTTTSPAKTAHVRSTAKGKAPLRFVDDGTIEYDHLDGVTHILDAPTIGQLRRVFEVDGKHQFPVGDVKDADLTELWDLTVRFMSDVFAIFGVAIPVDEWPHWAASNDVRRAVMDHWLSVPFTLPPSRRRQKTEATETAADPTPTPTEPTFE